MKKFSIALCLALVVLFCVGCTNDTIVGQWTTEYETDHLGISINSNFIQTITHLTISEDGRGSWEIEIVASRQILRREFTYTLEGDQLRMLYPDGTEQRFTVSFEKGFLNLTGLENFSLKRINK